MSESALRLYTEIWGKDHDEFDAKLDRSLSPRGLDALYDSFGKLGVGPGSWVLDIGCRNACGAVEIARRFGCQAIGVDPVLAHVEWASTYIAENGAADRVSTKHGRMEAIPLPDASVDFIWARDMVSHVDLSGGLAECCRVLKPEGSMLVYQAFATSLMAREESVQMYRALAIVPDNMNVTCFEATARGAGFELAGKEVIGSEWREAALQEAEGANELTGELLKVSRLLRQRDGLVREFGAELVETTYWGELWCAYILIGKLCPTIYTLTKPASG